MSGYLEVFKKENNASMTVLRDDMKARKQKDFFWPSGTQVYVGRQGSGKTVSAVRHLLRLKKRYPKAIVVTNLSLNRMREAGFNTEKGLSAVLAHMNPRRDYIRFNDMEQLKIALVSVNNGFFGVIYVIDEIHTYFNALESKNIPMYVFTEISQQRKQRKLIIGTSQLFMRMAKPLREQCDNIIVCSTRFGLFTKQIAYDGMTLTQDYDGSLLGNKKKTGWFFHDRELRGAFDTYQKVISGKEQFEQIERPEKLTKKGKRKN